MSDKPLSKPHGSTPPKIRAPIRWTIAAISLASSVIAYLDIALQGELPQAYFRGRDVGTLAADYAILIACVYLALVAATGRWLLFPGRK